MAIQLIRVTTVAILAMLSAPALAEDHVGTVQGADYFEGLYRPAGADGATWSCNSQFIGQDRGALAILDGYLEGLENRCKLSNPSAIDGDRTEFEATCSGEGSSYTTTVILGRTADGISLGPVEDDVRWLSCEPQSNASADGNRWRFDGSSAVILHEGLAFSVACEMFNPSATYPTATLAGYCPMCLGGDSESLVLQVDDGFSQAYEFEKANNAVGWVSELDYYPTWFQGLVPSLMSGSRLVITSRYGDEVAEFPLAGSSVALTALRDQCR